MKILFLMSLKNTDNNIEQKVIEISETLLNYVLEELCFYEQIMSNYCFDFYCMFCSVSMQLELLVNTKQRSL